MDRGRGGGRTNERSRSSTPRRSNIPSPNFSGCWCYGKEGHSRKYCPVFKSLKVKNGGRVPKDYEGAYEKSLKAKKTTAAVLTSASAEPSLLEEYDETYVWPLITAKGKIKHPTPAASSTNNRFAAFSGGVDDDESDDEEEMVHFPN